MKPIDLDDRATCTDCRNYRRLPDSRVRGRGGLFRCADWEAAGLAGAVRLLGLAALPQRCPAHRPADASAVQHQS